MPREQESAIDINSRLAQIITGVRRSGKSTLAHRALKGTNYAYVNFDDERLAGLNADNLNLVLEALYTVYGEFSHLLLDEIQNIEHWYLFVNRLLRNNIKIILTGSNSKLLNREMASHLTGRYSTIELFPFSFHEYLIAKGKKWSKTGTAREKAFCKVCITNTSKMVVFLKLLQENQNTAISTIFSMLLSPAMSFTGTISGTSVLFVICLSTLPEILHLRSAITV